eukprot:scaffold10321_cov63-Phaeocystis_antarctica.AAC.1
MGGQRALSQPPCPHAPDGRPLSLRLMPAPPAPRARRRRAPVSVGWPERACSRNVTSVLACRCCPHVSD